MTILETGSLDPAYNLAFEETVFERRRTGDLLLLWQNDNTVVVGRHQITEAEIDPVYVRRHAVRVVRRCTGGGAVWHDRGNLNYSFITDLREGDAAEMFQEAVAGALRALGVPAEVSGRNDILVRGQKVSGTAQRVSGDRLLHHGTLLFSSDLDALAAVLRVDGEKYRSRGTASVRGRVGNIADHLPRPMTMETFRGHLLRTLAPEGESGTLTGEERAAVETLRREKYDAWSWNYGASPAYETRRRAFFPGGEMDIRLTAARGDVIERIGFYGSFLSEKPLEELTEALRGTPLRRQAVEEVLCRFDLRSLFGPISAEEILDLLFS